MKADVPRISKMWYFLGVALFKGELLPVAVGSNSKKNSAKFVTVLIFANRPKISRFVDFEQQ